MASIGNSDTLRGTRVRLGVFDIAQTHITRRFVVESVTGTALVGIKQATDLLRASVATDPSYGFPLDSIDAENYNGTDVLALCHYRLRVGGSNTNFGAVALTGETVRVPWITTGPPFDSNGRPQADPFGVRWNRNYSGVPTRYSREVHCWRLMVRTTLDTNPAPTIGIYLRKPINENNVTWDGLVVPARHAWMNRPIIEPRGNDYEVEYNFLFRPDPWEYEYFDQNHEVQLASYGDERNFNSPGFPVST